MPEHSPAQKQYLLRVRRKKYMIHVSRILLFLGFLFLWEVDDQVSKSLAGANEFSDDHADKAQPNIDFHHT